MKLKDAALIDQILEYGVVQFLKMTNHEQKYLYLSLNNIRVDLDIDEPLHYVKELIFHLKEISPCPVKISGELTVIEFTQATVDFLNEGGYLSYFKSQQAKIQKAEAREDVDHELKVKSLKGNWIIYAGFGIAVFDFLWRIYEMIKK